MNSTQAYNDAAGKIAHEIWQFRGGGLSTPQQSEEDWRKACAILDLAVGQMRIVSLHVRPQFFFLCQYISPEIAKF
jgi:hypothetical protein